MEPRQKLNAIKIGLVIGVLVLLVAFFFLGRLFAPDPWHGLQHDAHGHRQLSEQQSGRDPVPEAGRIGNRHSMPSESTGH